MASPSLRVWIASQFGSLPVVPTQQQLFDVIRIQQRPSRRRLHFRPSHWDRWSQQLEVTSGGLLQDQPVPLLLAQLSALR